MGVEWSGVELGWIIGWLGGAAAREKGELGSKPVMSTPLRPDTPQRPKESTLTPNPPPPSSNQHAQTTRLVHCLPRLLVSRSFSKNDRFSKNDYGQPADANCVLDVFQRSRCLHRGAHNSVVPTATRLSTNNRNPDPARRGGTSADQDSSNRHISQILTGVALRCLVSWRSYGLPCSHVCCSEK